MDCSARDPNSIGLEILDIYDSDPVDCSNIRFTLDAYVRLYQKKKI